MERSVIFMKLKKLKSAILSGVVAVSTLAGTLAPVAAPSLTANAADSDNYAKLLQYSLYFYDANMCGNEVNDHSRLSWRGNCHTSDEVPGGYHDAGDHAMFGQPQGYAASTLGWAYYEFKDAFDATGQTAHYKTIADHFAKFFRDATVLNGGSVSKVLIEKGDGNMDHAYWGPPENQGDRGRMLWTSDGAANITAEYAAALAANYINFGNPDDLTYAKALYNFAKQHQGSYSCEFYGNKDTSDELGWAACWLYLATKDNSYKSDVQNIGPAYWVHCWENVSLGAAILKGEITGDWSSCNYLGDLNGDGYKFIDAWGSARHNCTAQMCALVADKYGHGNAAWAKTQMEYITGDRAFNNGQKYCLVVGYKPNASSMPHHRAASGTQSAETDGTPSKYSLVGALCGGPTDANGSYQDKRSDYQANEVAVDYNAGFVGAAAGLYSKYKTGSTVDPSSIPGVKGGVSDGGSSGTTPTGTTQTTSRTTKDNTTTVTTTNGGSSSGDIVLTPSDMTVDVEKGDDGSMNNFAEFKPQGAKSCTLYYKVNSNDMNTSGAFGTWTGKWEQKDFSDISVPSDKIVSVDYTIPSNVGQTVKAMIFWPHGDDVTIQKVVLHTGSSSGGTTKTTTSRTTTSNRTTVTTTNGGSSSGGTEFAVKDVYRGVIGDLVKSGAKSITFYIDASADTAFTYGFGVSISSDPWWNELDVSGKFIDTKGGTVDAEGTPTKLTAGLNKVTIDLSKLSLSYSDSSSQYEEHFEFRNYYADKSATLKITDVKINDASAPVTSATTTRTTTTTTRTTTTTTRTTTRTTTTTTRTTTTTTTTSTLTATMIGDANNDNIINLADTVMIMQALANPDKYGLNGFDRSHITAQGWENADCCNRGDGVTNSDALAIQKYLLNLINSLPTND